MRSLLSARALTSANSRSRANYREELRRFERRWLPAAPQAEKNDPPAEPGHRKSFTPAQTPLEGGQKSVIRKVVRAKLVVMEKKVACHSEGIERATWALQLNPQVATSP